MRKAQNPEYFVSAFYVTALATLVIGFYQLITSPNSLEISLLLFTQVLLSIVAIIRNIV